MSLYKILQAIEEFLPSLNGQLSLTIPSAVNEAPSVVSANVYNISHTLKDLWA